MSNAVLLKLPRFDVAQTEILEQNEKLREWQPHLHLTGPPVTSVKKTSASDFPIAEAAHTIERAPLDETSADLEDAISALQNAINDLRKQHAQQVGEAVSTLANALFPQLSRLFLAEEISRHLPRLIPVEGRPVAIHAAPLVARALEKAAARSGVQLEGISITASESHAAGQVDVSWQGGGFEFDFDALLGSSLAKMNLPPRSQEPK
jgi:hypothetical protein